MNPFQVGDILASSWGATMTLVNFYRVIRCSKKTVTIQPLESIETSDGGYLTGTSIPMQNMPAVLPRYCPQTGGTVWEAREYKRYIREGYDGQACVLGATDSERCYKWDGKPLTYNHCD